MVTNTKLESHFVILPEPHGSPVQEQYRLTRDSHYNSIYEKVGSIDLREYINSFKTGCSLKSIIDRCQLLPVHDKIRYLQQREDGLSADLSKMPSDGFEARLMLQELRTKHPDIYARSANGESLDAILKSFVSDPADGRSKSDAIVINSESEVNSNG